MLYKYHYTQASYDKYFAHGRQMRQEKNTFFSKACFAPQST